MRTPVLTRAEDVCTHLIQAERPLQRPADQSVAKCKRMVKLPRSSTTGAVMIRIVPTQDGTWTVYHDALAIITGLTRLQAERYEAGSTPTTRSADLAGVPILPVTPVR